MWLRKEGANSSTNVERLLITKRRFHDELYVNRLLLSSVPLGKPRTPGGDHPDVADTYNNIGLVYKAQGDYPMALEVYRKALRIWLKALGDGRGCALASDVAEAINALAVWHIDVFNCAGFH